MGRRRIQDRRQADLCKIHLGKDQLGLDEETYREMLQQLTGARSSINLDESGRRKVLAHMRKCGAVFTRPGRTRLDPGKRPLLNKIYALLGDRPSAYAEGILKQMFDRHAPQRLEWATPAQLHKVVAALEYDRQRKARRSPDRETGRSRAAGQ